MYEIIQLTVLVFVFFAVLIVSEIYHRTDK